MKVKEKVKKAVGSAVYKKASIGLGSSFLTKVGGMGLAFALQLVLTRVMGTEDYGAYAYVDGWLKVAVLIGTFGFTSASARYVSKYKSQRRYSTLARYIAYSRRRVLYISVVCGFSLALGGWIAYDANNLKWTFLVAGLCVPFTAVLNVASAELRALGEVIKARVPPKIIKPLLLGGSVLAAGTLFEIDVDSMTAQAYTGCAAALSLGVGFYLANKVLEDNTKSFEKTSRISRVEAKWIWSAKDMLLVSGFNLVLLRADTLMVGALVGTEQAGIYSIATKVANALNFFLIVVNFVLGPIVSELHSNRKTKKLKKIVKLSSRLIFIATFLLAIGIGVFRSEVMNLFGEAFTSGSSALTILAAAQVINASAGSAILILKMTGREKISTYIMGASAVVNLALNFTMIPVFGLEGAALATGTTVVFWNILAVYYCRKEANTNPFFL